jgi:hypothetical protein
MVNITKKSKIQVALFVSICLIKFFLLGCQDNTSKKSGCAYESQKRIRMLGPGKFTEEELISICGKPDTVMNASELYEYLNEVTDNDQENRDIVNQVLTDSYIGCKWYLMNYEPIHDTWRKSELFSQFDFYIYDEEIELVTCIMGRKKRGPYSLYYIVNDSKVINTGMIPKVKTDTKM